MMKRLEIDGRIVTVYPKSVEVNGQEVITQGEVSIESVPEMWAPTEIEQDLHALVKEAVPQQTTAIEKPSSG